MLPASLGPHMIVKNTFLDFDDSCLNREPRRRKTESAINVKTLVEYYDHYNASRSTSPASSRGRSSAYSGFTEDTEVESMNSPTPQDQLKLEQESRQPVILPSKAIDTSVVAQACASTTAIASSMAPTVYHWRINAKKLRTNDRSVVSRPFTLAVGGPGSEGDTSKLMLYARVLKKGKSGQSFKLSGGQGSLQLKCENELGGPLDGKASLRFSLAGSQESRLVHHNFSQSAACASPDWDFGGAVDKSTQTLVVSVEVMAA